MDIEHNKLDFSVVIPARNAEPWISKALQSIKNQSLSVREVIVVDNGSTDATSDISKRSGAKVISCTEPGVSAARNTGIRAASAPYIILLDADDCLSSNFMSLITNAIRLKPDVRLIFGNITFEDADGRLIEPNIPFASRLDAVNGTQISKEFLQAPADLYTRLLRGNSYCVSSSGLVIHRDTAIRCELYDTTITIAEDVDFILRYLRQPGGWLYSYEIFAHVLKAGHNTTAVTPKYVRAENFIRSKQKLLRMATDLHLNPTELDETNKALQRDFVFILQACSDTGWSTYVKTLLKYPAIRTPLYWRWHFFAVRKLAGRVLAKMLTMHK